MTDVVWCQTANKIRKEKSPGRYAELLRSLRSVQRWLSDPALTGEGPIDLGMQLSVSEPDIEISGDDTPLFRDLTLVYKYKSSVREALDGADHAPPADTVLNDILSEHRIAAEWLVDNFSDRDAGDVLDPGRNRVTLVAVVPRDHGPAEVRRCRICQDLAGDRRCYRHDPRCGEPIADDDVIVVE